MAENKKPSFSIIQYVALTAGIVAAVYSVLRFFFDFQSTLREDTHINKVSGLEQELKLERQKNKFEKEALKLELTKCKSSMNDNLNMSIKKWEGIWVVNYGGKFEHNLTFIKNSHGTLEGKYLFNNTTGEIIVNDYDDRYLKGTWTQKVNGKNQDHGSLTFIISTSNKFEGIYTKASEKYDKPHLWLGLKKDNF